MRFKIAKIRTPDGEIRQMVMEKEVTGSGGVAVDLTAAMVTGALGYTPAKQTDVDDLSEAIADLDENKQPVGDYALRSEIPVIPDIPVQSVNGKTGAVNLTAADVGATTQEYVDGEIADLKTQGLQQVPAVPDGETVDDQLTWLEENGDTSKIYLLADNYLYRYMKHETIVDGGEKPAFTNLKDSCTYNYQKRYSMSSGAFTGNTTGTAVVIPVPSGIASVTIRIKGVGLHGSYTAVYGGTSATAFTDTLTAHPKNGEDENGIITYTTSKDSTITYIVMNFAATQASDFDNAIITVNEPIEYTTGSEVVVTEGFANTGHAFVPADYESRIVSLENKSVNIAKNTNRIEALEGMVGTVNENVVVHNAIGATYPPAQKPTSSTLDGCDIDLLNSTADDVFAYIDGDVNGKKTVTKEILGKDASGQYDIARYIYANREYIAWCRENYPKMYAWKNDSTVVYSTSVSPRIGDAMYETPYIGTIYGEALGVSAANRSRTVEDEEFVRYESGDISPTVIYTDKDDDRNSNATIMDGGIIYNRYPMGDLGANRKKLIPVFIYANEHGIVKDTTAVNTYEDKLVGLMAARILRDFAVGKQTDNPLYKWMRENCMLIVIPVANPYGFNYNVSDDNNGNSGYYNANKVNINRNYDTPGWDVFKAANPTAATGAYPGSENETQYVMNTMVESGAVVAMSLHGYASQNSICAHQGQNPGNVDYNQDKLAKISSFTQKNWGYRFVYYDSEPLQNTPDVTAKSPSYITQCGAYGGILEITSDDNRVSGLVQEANSHVCENAYAIILNSTAMWLSDYLES